MNNNNKYVSRTLCESSKKYVRELTHDYNYINYNNYIKKIIKSFVNSQHILLNNIFKIKNECNFDITYKQEVLGNNNIYNIPSFIDIFRYLITINEFINQFTQEEKKILIYNLHKSKPKKNCYSFLDKSPIGKKILSVYNNFIYNYASLYTNLIIKFPSIKFHSLLINSFTSYKILEDLESKVKKVILFSIEWKGIKLDNIIYLFIYDNEKFDNHKEILNLGRNIIKRLLFFNEFLNTNKYPNKFILFLTNKKKEIDNELINQLHFKTININTAVTNSKDIIIYRKEELFKSIFHECIHFHNLDFRNISSTLFNNIINYLINTHNINSNNTYLLYECVTETLANILNIIYYSGDIKSMTTHLENEIIFSTLQVSKILHICKYNKWEEFSFNNIINNNKSFNNKKTNKQFKQDSCVYSYYILKLYILLNLTTYFNTIIDNKLKFIQTEENFNNLIKLFDLSRTNLLLKKIINSILKGLYLENENENIIIKKYRSKTHLKKNIKKNINKKTLRMTCIESNIFTK